MVSQNPKSRVQNSGFTLIELIIYLAIVSMLLVSMSYLIIDLVGGQTTGIAKQEVIYNFRFAQNKLFKDIRSARAINGLAADSLVLDMAGDDITYVFDGDSKRLTRQAGTEPAIDLLSDSLEVTGSFTDRSFPPRVENVGINLILNYKNPDNLPEYNASTTVNFSVELRGRR